MSWTTRLKNRQLGLGAAAVVVGALSFWFAHRYLRAQELATRQRVAAQYQTRDVVVAAADIAVGSVIEPGVLAKRAVPVRFLASDAYAPELVGVIAGRRALRTLRSGEPLTASAVESLSNPVLSALIEPGLRAVTIPVDESSAAAGLLAPGDLVDLLLVTRDANSSTGSAAVRPLLQAVRVVATGRQTRRAVSNLGAGAGGAAIGGIEADNSFATLTLHVRPEDAERILLGERVGELSVLLRSGADTEAGVVATLDSNVLLGGGVRRPSRTRAHAVAIEYIIGGGSGVSALHRASKQLGVGGQP